MMNNDSLRERIIRHEAIRLKPYLDDRGYLTIGVGRNLDSKGITRGEALLLLENDLDDAYREASTLEWFANLGNARQDVIVEMIFNLGMRKFLKFTDTIAALKNQDYGKAATEMLNSDWARQVKGRAVELSGVMRFGKES